jgi:hypothetical protein
VAVIIGVIAIVYLRNNPAGADGRRTSMLDVVRQRGLSARGHSSKDSKNSSSNRSMTAANSVDMVSARDMDVDESARVQYEQAPPLSQYGRVDFLIEPEDCMILFVPFRFFFCLSFYIFYLFCDIII